MIEISPAPAEDWREILTNTDFPGIILLGLASIPAMFFLVRWMVRFQREFTDFYIQENQKLRDRVEALETENQEKDQLIVDLRNKVGKLENHVDSHERTIEYLNGIIERRRTPREK